MAGKCGVVIPFLARTLAVVVGVLAASEPLYGLKPLGAAFTQDQADLRIEIAFIASQTSYASVLTVAELEGARLFAAYPNAGMTELKIIYAIVKAVRGGEFGQG